METSCDYMWEDKERYAYNCAITGRFCVAAVDAGGRIDVNNKYMDKAAKFCPAYNLKKELANLLQNANLERQRLELEKRLK